MPATECSRHSEALDLVLSSQWPESAPQELVEHVARCKDCGEVVAVADAIRADLAATSNSVRIPPSGVMFWRAQRRAAQEAVRSTHRRTVLAQTLSVAAGVGVGIAGLRSTAQWIDWRGLFHDATSFLAPIQLSLPITLAITLCVMAAPIALFVALRED